MLNYTIAICDDTIYPCSVFRPYNPLLLDTDIVRASICVAFLDLAILSMVCSSVGLSKMQFQ